MFKIKFRFIRNIFIIEQKTLKEIQLQKWLFIYDKKRLKTLRNKSLKIQVLHDKYIPVLKCSE